MTKLSLIILSYNTKDLLLKCVRSVLKQYKKQIGNNEFEVFVVDNASSDSSVQSLKNFKELKVIYNEENYGFSKGNNKGAKKAHGEVILFLNSDTEIKDQGFLGMVNFLLSNQKIGILGGKLKNSDGTSQPSIGKFYTLLNLSLMMFGGERFGLLRESPKKIKKTDWVSGACFMVKRNLFNKLLGFDEKFFMYIEDMELCYRAKKLGFDTYFFPNLNLIHKELGSSNREFAVKQIYKGLLYFYKKHKPYWQYLIVKILLFAKALFAYFIGTLSNNLYLKRTYGQALKLSAA